jgi:hypothetical protein
MCHEIPRAGSFAELRSPRNDKLREKLEPGVGFARLGPIQMFENS